MINSQLVRPTECERFPKFEDGPEENKAGLVLNTLRLTAKRCTVTRSCALRGAKRNMEMDERRCHGRQKHG